MEQTAQTSSIELVKQAYAAFLRKDFPAVLSMLTDDAEWRFIGARGLPHTAAVRGKDAIARWFQSIAETDDIRAFEPRELLGGGDVVTVLGWERTAAVPEGELFEAEWIHVFVFRDGKVARFHGMYDTEASARARKGVSAAALPRPAAAEAAQPAMH